MGNLDATVAREAGSRFETMVEESFVVLLPNRDAFDRTRDWLSRFETSLRAGTPCIACLFQPSMVRKKEFPTISMRGPQCRWSP